MPFDEDRLDAESVRRVQISDLALASDYDWQHAMMVLRSAYRATNWPDEVTCDKDRLQTTDANGALSIIVETPDEGSLRG